MRKSGRPIVQSAARPPYALPPIVVPSPDETARLSPWAVLEFLRRELLLRSPTIWALYKRDRRRAGSTLLRTYGFDWGVLKGEHYDLLRTDAWVLRPGIWDLRSMEHQMASFLIRDFKNPRMVFLALDTGYTPDQILEQLKPLLTHWHRAVGPIPVSEPALGATLSTAPHRGPSRVVSGNLSRPRPSIQRTSLLFPYSPQQRPKLRNLAQTWMKRLQCYDAHVYDQEGWRTVARRVYGTPNHATKAQQAVKAVRQMITDAASPQWAETWTQILTRH